MVSKKTCILWDIKLYMEKHSLSITFYLYGASNDKQMFWTGKLVQ